MPPIRVFVSRAFDRFTHRERIDDEVLINAIEEIERGLIDAELGGSVYKKRIARRGEGKSSGYRTIVVFRSGDRAVFIEGFPKNSRTTHAPDELRALREAAKDFLQLTTDQIERTLRAGRLREIRRDDKD